MKFKKTFLEDDFWTNDFNIIDDYNNKLRIYDLVSIDHKNYNKYETFKIIKLKKNSAIVQNVDNLYMKYTIKNLNILKKI